MKQQKIIKQMVRSVAKLIYTVFCLFLLFLGVSGYAQVSIDSKFTDAQYGFLNDVFDKSSIEPVKIYYRTLNARDFVQSLLKEKEKNRIGGCVFELEEFNKIILEFNDIKATSVQYKILEKNRIHSEIKIVRKKNKKNIVFISEPIIVSKYGFILIKTQDSEIVEIYRHESKRDWKFHCFITLYANIYD